MCVVISRGWRLEGGRAQRTAAQEGWERAMSDGSTGVGMHSEWLIKGK